MTSRQGMTFPILVGGLVGGILSSIPFCNILNCFCCSLLALGGAIAGGLLASQANQAGRFMNVGEGALAGALAGLGAGVLSAIIDFGIQMAFPRNLEAAMFMKNFGNNPEAQKAMRQVMALLDKPFLFFMVGLVAKTIFGSVFGALGGLLGVLIVRKPQPPQVPPLTSAWNLPPAGPPPPADPFAPPPPPEEPPKKDGNNPFGAGI